MTTAMQKDFIENLVRSMRSIRETQDLSEKLKKVSVSIELLENEAEVLSTNALFQTKVRKQISESASALRQEIELIMQDVNSQYQLWKNREDILVSAPIKKLVAYDDILSLSFEQNVSLVRHCIEEFVRATGEWAWNLNLSQYYFRTQIAEYTLKDVYEKMSDSCIPDWFDWDRIAYSMEFRSYCRKRTGEKNYSYIEFSNRVPVYSWVLFKDWLWLERQVKKHYGISDFPYLEELIQWDKWKEGVK